MIRSKVGTAIFVILLVLVWTHMTALRNFWYWQMPWFDTIVHFLGGVFVGTILLYILLNKHSISEIPLRTGFIVFGTFAIGFLWEVFEHFFNIAFDPQKGFDNVVDLAMDTLGGFVVYLIAIKASHSAKKLEDQTSEAQISEAQRSESLIS